MEERVQKILSQWGIASRRQAEKMIDARRVRLNGVVVNLGQKADPTVDLIEVDGLSIEPGNRPKLLYLLLNKPGGVVSSCRDSWGRTTILELLPPKMREGQGLHPVGRLDAESTGALLLTNDGSLTFRLTHPCHHVSKTYHVWVQGNPPESVLQDWRGGVELSGKRTLPAGVRVLRRGQNKTLLEIILREGRNRQIRRVAELLSYRVIHLHRIAIGSIKLQLPGEPILQTGSYRYLKDFEIHSLTKKSTPAQ